MRARLQMRRPKIILPRVMGAESLTGRGSNSNTALIFARAPEIKGRRGTMGPPALAVAFEDDGFRKFALVEDDFESFADGQVVNREDVRPAQVEDQKHFDRPAPDTFDFGEARQDFGVGECVYFGEFWNGAGEQAGSEIANVSGLWAREPDAAQGFGISTKDFACGGEVAIREQRAEAAEDGFGRTAAELLIGDGAHEGLEAGDAARFVFDRTDALDKAGEDRIGFPEMVVSGFIHLAGTGWAGSFELRWGSR